VVEASPVDRCFAVAQAYPLVQKASLEHASLKRNETRLTYVGHSTFLIESHGGIKIATDYNDYVKPDVLPDIATMNRAHSTHYTDHPESGIRHVLRGWNPSGGAVTHDVELGDVRVRNVVTNIRDFVGGTLLYANSIFIFEIAGLCIAHLGHLHHTLTPKHLEQIGQIDVVLVPVDGSYTMDLPGMIEVLKALRARLIVPMHYFSEFGLARFLDPIAKEFEVKRHPSPAIVLTRAGLPAEPLVLVLPGR
jgi:L-ascorbate metabolism protein UlaG (beta-lactamase superfamily)